MFDIQNYTSFIIAVLIFQLVPGAGTIAILNATARDGKVAGMASVAGTLAGDFIYMIAAIIGLAAVLNANPLLLKFLQLFGSIYLCWMGIQLLRSRMDTEASSTKARQSAWKYFRQACAVSLTNPKVILFFVSFFPLFLAPDSSRTTLLVMIVHVTLISLLYQALLVIVGNRIALYLKALPYARKLATRMAGMALIGFGVKLAINNR